MDALRTVREFLAQEDVGLFAIGRGVRHLDAHQCRILRRAVERRADELRPAVLDEMHPRNAVRREA